MTMSADQFKQTAEREREREEFAVVNFAVEKLDS